MQGTASLAVRGWTDAADRWVPKADAAACGSVDPGEAPTTEGQGLEIREEADVG
jgi:hypothetical protein